MSQVHHDSRRHGFTIVELLVVVAIISLLIAILLPAMGKAKEQAFRASCASSERQLHFAMVAYGQDHHDIVTMSLNEADLRGYLPPKGPGTSNGSGVDLHYRGCPSKGLDEPSTGWGGRSFGTTGTVYGGWSYNVENGYLPLKFAKVRKPAITAVGGDCYTVRIVDPGQHEVNTAFKGRHRGQGLNFWFFDGHARFLLAHTPDLVTGHFPDAEWRHLPNNHGSFNVSGFPRCSYNGCFWHAY